MATNNVLYVNDGNYGPPDHSRAGRLAPMVQGQYGQDVKLEIRNMVGSVMALTGFSTITGYKQKGGSVTEIVGTLTLSGTPTAAPQITWVVAAEDTGAYGTFDVVFRIGDGTDLHKTHPVKLEIRPDPEAAGLPAAPAVVGVTEAEKAILADFLAAAVAAAAGQVYVFDGADSGAEGYPGTKTTTQSGTSYTFALTDKDTIVQSTNGSATIFTVPANATVAFPVGTVIGFEQYGAGVLSIAAAGGVTINNPHAGLSVSAQYGCGAVRKIATNEWMIIGMLE